MSTQSAQPNRLIFPKGFKWGASTAAYQIEGAVNEDGRLPSVWDTFSHTPGKIANDDTGDIACDHYHRYREDVDLMERLGLKAYRFSIGWPRILPTGTGAVNKAGLDFYDRLIDALLAKGIEPFATLNHWDMPQPLEDKGGWLNRATIDAYVNYADVVTRSLGDRVKNWMTHNEPWVVSIIGYVLETFPPGQKGNWRNALLAAHHLLVSHGKAVPVIRANGDARTQVGIATNLSWTDAASDSPDDIAAARRHDGYLNRWFLDPLFKARYPADMVELYGADVPTIQAGDMETIAVPIDFLGINYYTRAVIGAGDEMGRLKLRTVRPAGEYTAMNWEVYPKGLYNLLMQVHQDYKPATIYVAENGAAFADEIAPDGKVYDPRRLAYLDTHLTQAHRAIQDGAPLRGYFLWSLMDNFEWTSGYSKRFGLTYVDYPTQRRIIKQSGEWYAQVARENGFVPSHT